MGYAMLLSLLAGLATGLGGLAAVATPRISARTLAGSMGFAAGVMLTVSLGDMLPHATREYMGWMPPVAAGCAAGSLCFLGALAALLLAQILPDPQRLAHGAAAKKDDRAAVARTAMVVALALAAHNLPEGMLTLFGGLESPQFGMRLALAVALHNIPEGIAVSVPMAYAAESRWKGAGWALASGLAEPLGAILALALLRPVLTPGVLNGSIALIAGLMSGVSAGELLPGGIEAGGKKAAVAGFGAGAAVMLLGIAVLGE